MGSWYLKILSSLQKSRSKVLLHSVSGTNQCETLPLSSLSFVSLQHSRQRSNRKNWQSKRDFLPMQEMWCDVTFVIVKIKHQCYLSWSLLRSSVMECWCCNCTFLNSEIPLVALALPSFKTATCRNFMQNIQWSQ